MEKVGKTNKVKINKILLQKCALSRKKSASGITLIALIITIIVLLLLAGVTIATLTGDNGILSQAQKAQEGTKIGKFRDEAHLAYMEVYAENARNGVYVVEEAELIAKLEDKYGYTIQPEPTGGITGITVKQNGTIVNTTTVATVEKADNTPAEVSTTLTVVPTPGEGSEYYIVEDGIYYKISLSGEIITIGEGQESVGGGTGSSGPTVEVTNKASLTKIDEPQISGLTITIVGRTAGDETLEISYSGKTATVKVTVMQTFAVNFYASSTGAEATLVKVADGGNALTATNYATAKSAADSAAPEGQVFDKWVLKTAVGTGTGEQVGDEATSYLNNVTQALNVYATYKEAPEFGDADTTLKSHFGKTVLTNSDITFGTAGWQLFYADTDKIYLIYADYLENGKIPSGTNILKSGYSVYGKSSTSTNRDTVINYLKTASNWTSVKSAFVNKYELNSSTTGVKAKGAPSVDMWMASYNARYGTNLGAKNFKDLGTNGKNQTYYNSTSATSVGTSTTTTSVPGYLYTRSDVGDSSKWEVYLPDGFMKNTEGYPTRSSNMYYPHTSEVSASSTTTYGYWLARSFG